MMKIVRFFYIDNVVKNGWWIFKNKKNARENSQAFDIK